ncbi:MULTISPECIES: hypothetical protein [Chitinophagaceae]
MTTIQLKEFIKTGKFGAISLGSTKTEVINILGDKFSFADCGDAQIIKYGWFEFFYYTDTEIVFGIQNDALQADCINHNEMINLDSELYRLDKWFLKDNENITFRQVAEYLNQENIPFDIVPAHRGSEENIIKCINSKVAFDFVNGYMIAELNAKGKVEKWKEVIEENQSDYVLNGIRLFDY